MRQHLLDHPASYYAIYFCVRHLPLGLCRFLGKNVARLVYAFSRGDRQVLAQNLAPALGRPAGHPEVRRTVRRLFENYGQYMVDFFLAPQLPPARAAMLFAGLQGQHFLQQALARQKGVILLTAHIGNWEFGSVMMRQAGHKLAVVVRSHNAAVSNSLINRLRKGRGIEAIEVDRTAFASLRLLGLLRKNRIIAMTGDRCFGNRALEVDLCSQKVPLPVGPVVLAMQSGAALIPTFVVKQPDGRYLAVLEKPLELVCKDNRREAVRINLQKTARIFEKYIRRYPDQWYCPEPISDRTAV